MRDLPESVDIGCSDGYALRGMYAPHTLGDEVELFVMTPDHKYDGAAEAYILPKGVITTCGQLDHLDRSGAALQQILVNYSRFRRNIPYSVSSQFAEMEAMFRVFPECSTPTRFLESFEVKSVWVHDAQPSSPAAFSFGFESKVDSGFVIEFRWDMANGEWLGPDVDVSHY